MSDNLINIGFSAFWDTAWLKAQPDGAVYLGKNVCGYKGKVKNEAVIIKDGTNTPKAQKNFGKLQHYNSGGNSNAYRLCLFGLDVLP